MRQELHFYRQRIARALPVLSKFASGQVLLQFLNIINGFFLLRWLSIEQQALFSFAFSMQTLLINISDLGFSSSIIALLGNKHGENGMIEKYVRTAASLKNKFFGIGLIICLVIGPLFITHQSVNRVFVLNIIPVVAAAFWQINSSIFSTPLIIKQEMGKFYLPQIISSFFKLICNYVFYLTSIISSFLILALNALALLFNSIFFKRAYKRTFQIENNSQTGAEDSDRKKEMIKYLSPLFPGLVFNAFYGQLQIFIISFFGKTQNIAEVAALGRLSQIFFLFNSLSALIVAPFIAKTDRCLLLRRYVFFILLGLAATLVLSLISVIIPQFYLIILGTKYYHLSREIPYIIITASLGAISGLLWSMNSARKWIYWWSTWTYIGGIVICQIFGVVYFDLSSTIGVLFLGLLTSVFVLLLHILTAIVGFKMEGVTNNGK